MQPDSASERIPKPTTGERGLAYLAEHQGERFTLATVARAIGVNYLVLLRHAEFIETWRAYYAPPTVCERALAYLAEHQGERFLVTTVARAIGVNYTSLCRNKDFIAAWRKDHAPVSAGERAASYVAEHKGKRLTLSKVARAIGANRKTLQVDETFIVAWRSRQAMQAKNAAGHPLSDLVESYIALRPELKSGSAEQIRCSVKAFDRFLDRPSNVEDLSEETLPRFVSSRLKNSSQSTAKRNRANLITLWRFAARKKLIPSPPVEGVPTVKGTRRAAIAWTLDEVTKILAACDQLEGRLRRESDQRHGPFVRKPYTGPLQSQWWAALVLFAFDTGTRVGALLQIAPSDIDLERGLVTLRGEAAKTDLEQVLRLSRQTVTAIRAIYDPQSKAVWSWHDHRRKLYLKLTEILKRAGLPHDRYRKFHCLRRTTATLTAAAGRRDLAQTTLGHTTPTMTNVYIDKRALPIESAADVLPRPAWGDSTSQTSPERPNGMVAEVLRELSAEQLTALLKLARALTEVPA